MVSNQASTSSANEFQAYPSSAVIDRLLPGFVSGWFKIDHFIDIHRAIGFPNSAVNLAFVESKSGEINLNIFTHAEFKQLDDMRWRFIFRFNSDDRSICHRILSDHHLILVIEQENGVQIRLNLEIWRPLSLAHEVSQLNSTEIGIFNDTSQALSESDIRNLLFSENNSQYNPDPLGLINHVERQECAILTYANGSGGYWKYFYRYYSENFDSQNIYVITQNPLAFLDYKLGAVMKVPSYDDKVRAYLSSNFRLLLHCQYSHVLIVDVDEIIVPLNGFSLSEWIAAYASRYEVVYPIGIDIVQLDSEQSFDNSFDVLSQRRYGIYNSNLSKPNLLPPGSLLSSGHHYSSVEPLPGKCDFSSLVCLHLKYACSDTSNSILATNLKTTYVDESIREYALATAALDSHPSLKKAKKLPHLSLKSAIKQNHQYVFSLKKAVNGLYSARPVMGSSIIDLKGALV
jgi:hypothetical protein